MLDSMMPPFVSKSAPCRPISRLAMLGGGVVLAFTALSICEPLSAQNAHFAGIVTTIANGTNPWGVAVDPSGNVYFAEEGVGDVKQIAAINGKIPPSPVINTIGGGFQNPVGLSADSHGNVFVADLGADAVDEVLAAGGYTTVKTIYIAPLGLFSSQVWNVAVDNHGDVFCLEHNASQIVELLAVNGSIPSAPRTEAVGSGFYEPNGVAVDGDGNVFVANPYDHSVKEVLASSGYTSVVTLATGVNPTSVAVDKGGNVFFASIEIGATTVNEIVAVNGAIPASPSILSLGSGFSDPRGLAVDGNGNVFVGDYGAGAVDEIQTAGADFGSLNLGSTSPSPITLTFAFDAATTLGNVSVVTAGSPGMDFLNAESGSCTADTPYNAGDTCTVTVNFGPLFPGTRYGSVVLQDPSGVTLASAPLKGVGVGPQALFATETPAGLVPGAQYAPTPAQFSGPSGVAINSSGAIFISESYGNDVYELATGGNLIPIYGFSNPSGLAMDGAGNVYVADTFDDSIRVILADSYYSTVLTVATGFSSPYGVAVDGSGNVFVADLGNDAVKEILAVNGTIPSTPTIRTVASGLNEPDGVAVDGNGNVFVANYGDGTVQEIEGVNGSVPASPTIRTLASGLSAPGDVTLDGMGNLFVTDSGNGAIDEIPAAGGYTSIKLLRSGFNGPEAVTVDKSGNVLVADTGNSMVETLAYPAIVTETFASTPVGLTSPDSPREVTVINAGNAPLVFPVPATGTNPSVPTGFVWDDTSTCLQSSATSTQDFQLSGGTSCTMAFDFKPTEAGSNAGAVVVTDNNLNDAGSMQSVQLEGLATAPAGLTSPTLSSVLAGPKVTFTWSAATGATGYIFRLGTTVGSNNLYSSGLTAATSYTPTHLPTNGEAIYARLVTNYGSNQVWTDYVFTAATQAALTSPTPSTALTGPSATFTWTTAPGATAYILSLGTTVGGNDLYTSGAHATTTFTAPHLPTNGETVYARLITVYGSSQVYTDYVYTAATQAALTSPTPGAILAGPKVTFTWTTAPGATGYVFRLGTTVGGNDLYSSGATTATSYTATHLPTNGETIYAQLVTSYGSSQVWTNYTYTATTPAVMTSPTPNTVLAGPMVTFSWSAGTSATGYSLSLGTTAGSNNLYYSGTKTATSFTAPHLPTDGSTIYARLTTVYGSGVVYSDYSYTTATQSALLSPAPGSVLTGSTVTFTWTAAPGATGYILRLGTTAGGNDLYSSSTTSTSRTPTKIPTNGETIYAQLVTVYGTSQAYTNYTYTAAP